MLHLNFNCYKKIKWHLKRYFPKLGKYGALATGAMTTHSYLESRLDSKMNSKLFEENNRLKGLVKEELEKRIESEVIRDNLSKRCRKFKKRL